MHIFYDGKKEKNMCGIVGYIGSKEKTLDVLLNGLTNLEYRGYDSAGIAYFNEDELKIVKSVGRIQKLRDKVMKESALLGIGHTRWATHGEANEKNSHPHHVGQITIVHNGIIENYEQLRKDLIQKGYQFQSDTDTEVACALLDYYYNEHKNIEYAIEECLKKLEGSYALGILVNGDENLYAVKNKSPLIIGTGNQENYIASDVPAILEETNQYIVLEDKEFSRISKDGITVYNQKGEIVSKEIKEFKGDSLSAKKDGYSHFMEKEMYEDPKVFKRISEQYVQENLDYFITKIPDFSKYEKIDIVACGSAYHAGLVGKNLIEEYAIVPVNVEVASEYRYEKHFNNKNTLVILVSQSGETADTLAALNIAKENNCDTLAIVNVVDSSIAREANTVLYTNAGPEIAVATTKAYSAQVAMLSLIAFNMALKKDAIAIREAKSIISDIKNLPEQIESLLNRDEYKIIANQIYEHNDVYFLGRKIDYAMAMEGSLKLKEISYIHSEAYPAGELKHGTISLIEDGTPVIGIITDEEISAKTISNMKETKARGAKLIAIKTENIETSCDYEITIPKTNPFLQPLLTIIPLQKIAYETAKLRNCDIDKPKNLAKSVTVE